MTLFSSVLPKLYGTAITRGSVASTRARCACTREESMTRRSHCHTWMRPESGDASTAAAMDLSATTSSLLTS